METDPLLDRLKAEAVRPHWGDGLDLERRLERAFAFGERDRHMNCDGRISGRQVRRLLRVEAATHGWIILAAAMLTAAGWIVVSLFIIDTLVHHGPPFNGRGLLKAVLAIPVGIGCLVYLAVRAWRVALDLLGRRVMSHHGVMHISETSMPFAWLWPWKRPAWRAYQYSPMGVGPEFKVPRDAAPALPLDLAGTFYYTRHARILLSIAGGTEHPVEKRSRGVRARH